MVSCTLLKSYAVIGQPCLIPDFNEISWKFSSSRIVLALSLSYVAFIILRDNSFTLVVSRTLMIKAFELSQKHFLHLFEMIIWFFSLSPFIYLFTCLLTFICWTNCISGINSMWTLWQISSYVSIFSLLTFYWEFSLVCSSRIPVCSFGGALLCLYLVWLLM